MPLTLKELAAQLQLSTAAVSLALNNKPGVSPATRELVQRTARELGYTANRRGKALRTGVHDTIGIYFPSTVLEYSLYYAEITRGIAAALAHTPLSPVILPSATDTGDLRDFPEVDGFVIVEAHADDRGVFELLRLHDTPTVCIDPPPRGADEPWAIIEADTHTSIITALEHFRSRGSARPAILTVETVSSWTRTLEHSYRQWCHTAQLPATVVRALVSENNDHLITVLTQAGVGEPGGCDALFICGDGIAVRIAGVLRSMGLIVGEDVQLISGVDSTMMKFHTPPITAIDMDPYRFGFTAASRVAQFCSTPQPRPDTPQRECLPAPLVIRAS